MASDSPEKIAGARTARLAEITQLIATATTMFGDKAKAPARTAAMIETFAPTLVRPATLPA
jgi:hypothetical protein